MSADFKALGSYAGPEVADSSLLLHLDAGNSKSYPGSGTTWTDLSGNGKHGTLTNGPTYSSSNGGSIVFDGTNDYVATSLTVASMPVTVSVWCYWTSGYATLYDSAPSTQNVIRAYDNYIEWWNGSPGTSMGLSTNTWYNIVGVYSSTASTRSLSYYRNGSVVYSNTVSTSPTFAWSLFNIGNTNYSYYFGGRISVVTVHNVALTADQVLQNYNALRGRFGL